MSKQGQLVYRTVSDFLNGKLNRKEAAEVLEVRERTVARVEVSSLVLYSECEATQSPR